MRRRAVFLDRDGTVIRDRPYQADPRGVELMPNAARGIRAWARAGYVPIIISNQSGIARALFGWDQLAAVNARMRKLLATEGVKIAAIYVCPHHVAGKVRTYARSCGCRKPRPGLIRRAARELGIDLRGSFMIGDSLKDARAARAAGVRAIRLGVDASDLLDAARRGRAAARRGTVPSSGRSRTDELG
ncbi:MAG: HAD family hydrolase [Planctomycetes bacterium]|nr:HAD family hydrolase [Planctomycetota bacterium]